jgi:hypothetical protein
VPSPYTGKYGIQSKTSATAGGTSYTVNANIAAFDSNITPESPYTYTDADTLFEDPDDYLNTFPDILEWPTLPSVYTINGGVSASTTIDSSEVTALGQNYVYIDGSVNISGTNSTLTFKTTTEMFIYVNGDFTLKGQGSNAASMILEGTGPIHIIVDGDLDLGANCVNELGQALGPEDFIFYVPPSTADPDRKVTLSGTTNISATIVAPDIPMDTTGTPNFSGISWVKSFEGSGNFTYNQDPVPDDFYDAGFFDWPLQITAYSN